MTTTDELAVNSSVYLSVRRSQGTFDMITVSYEVSTPSKQRLAIVYYLFQ